MGAQDSIKTQLLKEADYSISRRSGGTTTEIGIGPDSTDNTRSVGTCTDFNLRCCASGSLAIQKDTCNIMLREKGCLLRLSSGATARCIIAEIKKDLGS